MGYRSEVAIKCKEKAFDMLIDTCKETGLMPDTVYKDCDDFLLYWDWIKWYNDYNDVAAIENTLDKLDELHDHDDDQETGYGYKFMRIGEDDGDVETRENDWDIELWMVRKIDIPDGLEIIECQ